MMTIIFIAVSALSQPSMPGYECVTETRTQSPAEHLARTPLIVRSVSDITLGAFHIDSMAELEATLKTRIQANPKFAVLVSTGERQAFGLCIMVIDVCRKCGVTDIKVEGAPDAAPKRDA